MLDLLAQTHATGDIPTWVNTTALGLLGLLLLWLTREFNDKIKKLIEAVDKMEETTAKNTKANLLLVLEVTGERISPGVKREVEAQIKDIDERKK